MLTMNELIEKDGIEIYIIILKEYYNMQEDLIQLEDLYSELNKIRMFNPHADEIIHKGIRKITSKSKILRAITPDNIIPVNEIEYTYNLIRDTYVNCMDFIVKINQGYVCYGEDYIKQNVSEIKKFYLSNIGCGSLYDDVSNYILSKYDNIEENQK